MIPVFVDTAYFVALLNRTDRHHATAARWASIVRHQSTPLVTTAAVLAETGDGFARKGYWSLLQPVSASLLNDPRVEVVGVDRGLVAAALRLRDARRDKDWGLTDCVSFLVMEERGLTEALTGDRHFTQAGFRALLLE